MSEEKLDWCRLVPTSDTPLRVYPNSKDHPYDALHDAVLEQNIDEMCDLVAERGSALSDRLICAAKGEERSFWVSMAEGPVEVVFIRRDTLEPPAP